MMKEIERGRPPKMHSTYLQITEEPNFKFLLAFKQLFKFKFFYMDAKIANQLNLFINIYYSISLVQD